MGKYTYNMRETAMKRLKLKKKDAPKMFVDSEAVALSVIPFLDAKDLRYYLATNRRMHDQYDNDKLWRKVANQFFSSGYIWDRYTKRDIKKCVHFKELTYAHTLPRIMEEVTTDYQLNMFKVYVNKCDYSEHTKHVMRIMISLLAPRFLRRPYANYARYEELPENLRAHLRDMNTATMSELGEHMIDDRHA